MIDSMSKAIAAFEADLIDIMREFYPIRYREEFHDWLDALGIDIDSLEDDEDLP